MHIEAGSLQVDASAQAISVSLAGRLLFDFPVRVAVDTEAGNDRDLFEPDFRQEDNRCVWTVRSSNWERKELTLSIDGAAVSLRTRVSGRGRLTTLRFFPPADGGIPLRYEVVRYLIPAALSGAQSSPQWRNTMESSRIELGYMAPPMLAFPFAGDFPGCLAVGLAPRAGAYNIDHFECAFASMQDGLFGTDFLGYTEVDGEYELPTLTFTAGEDEFASLSAYADWLYEFGGCQRVDRTDVPRWWQGPLFCGWGEQGILAAGRSSWALTDPKACAGPAAMATQEVYSAMSLKLDELGLKPAAIIIDDKWQGRYGELLPDPVKWPDMRAFVDGEHAKGRRVMLWVKAWDNEGLRTGECTHCLCTPYGCDPTSPAYQGRITETMHRLLSSDEGCFDCDGFKIDFANCMPLGRNLATHESGVYGLELLKRLMTLLYESAKAVKPDCLVNTSVGHPYFAGVTDQCRLHDFSGQLRNLWEVRAFRAKLFRTAFPGVSIDTDDAATSSKAQTLDYLHRAPELGVPSLYRLHGSENLPLTDEDFHEIARIWTEYAGGTLNPADRSNMGCTA